MRERKQDKLLGIRTVGIREWKGGQVHFNRYEATPYKALEILFENYKLDESDQVVDFGCGRGRVAFYIHNRFHVPVTGVEVNDLTFEEALDNKARYQRKAKHISAPINFEYGNADHYEVKKKIIAFIFLIHFQYIYLGRLLRTL